MGDGIISFLCVSNLFQKPPVEDEYQQWAKSMIQRFKANDRVLVKMLGEVDER